MKNINENEKVNRADHVIPARYLIFFLILIFIGSACTAFADSDKKTETQSTWKEIKLVLDAIDYAWCGNRHIVFGDDKYGKKSRGIFIYDTENGAFEDIADDPDHDLDLKHVSCTADGRYVFFVRKKFMKKESHAFIFDRNTKAIQKYEQTEGAWLILSPYANYILGPALAQGQKYILPGGKVVKVVPRREGALGKFEFNKLQWSDDERNIFLFDIFSGKFATYNIAEDKLDTLLISVKGQLGRFGKIRITRDNKMYFVALLYTPKHMEEPMANLYVFNLEKPGEKPILLVSDISVEDFDMDDEGNLVYSKYPNDNDLPDCKYSEIGLYFLEKGKKEAQLLKKYKCYIHSYGIEPKISRNGKGIFFVRSTGHNKPKEFTILIKD